MGDPWYTTLEVVKAALSNQGGQRADAQIRRLIADHSRGIDRSMNRTFHPWTGTRYFTWPATSGLNAGMPSWVVELGRDELISLTSLGVGGPDTYTTVDLGAVLLEPVNAGPPFTRLELSRGTTASLESGSTEQRSLAVTGVFGYSSASTTVTTAAANATDTATTVTVLDSAEIGTGSLLQIGEERLNVTARRWHDTGGTLLAPLTDKPSSVSVGVVGGNIPQPGETILIDAERMFVEDTIGTALIVKRAVDGSVLATHGAGVSLFAPRALIVERGAVGTTAAAISAGDAVAVWQVPGPIHTLCMAEVISSLQQEQAGYGRTVGSEGNEREAVGRGLTDARCRAEKYRRRNRNLAV